MERTFPINNLIRSEIGKQNNCLINNQSTYPFFISNEFIDFSQRVFTFSEKSF